MHQQARGAEGEEEADGGDDHALAAMVTEVLPVEGEDARPHGESPGHGLCSRTACVTPEDRMPEGPRRSVQLCPGERRHSRPKRSDAASGAGFHDVCPPQGVGTPMSRTNRQTPFAWRRHMVT